MNKISPVLRTAVRGASVRQYQLAQLICVHPSTLSAWLNGIIPVRPGDPRILQLGALVGVPPESCFEVTANVMAARR